MLNNKEKIELIALLERLIFRLSSKPIHDKETTKKMIEKLETGVSMLKEAWSEVLGELDLVECSKCKRLS